jgi:DNA-binding LacI/PurR family transcriptional regulator
VRIPEELSVVGFDNFPGTAPAPVPLTTMAQNAYERGLLLGAWLTHPDVRKTTTILGTDLVIRESTGLAPE